MISDRVALQLAGLQAQVVLGAYEEGKDQRYREVEQYLCKRVLSAPCRDWSEEVATAHKVVLLYFFGYKMEFFPSRTIPKI